MLGLTLLGLILLFLLLELGDWVWKKYKKRKEKH